MDISENSESIERIYIRRLPHIQTADKPIFLTWRLAFSIPQTIMEEMARRKKEFDQKIEKLSTDYKNMQLYQFNKEQFLHYDNKLADIRFPDLLKREEIAKAVIEALEYYQNKRYILLSYCIMPNHVHTVFQLQKESNGEIYSLAKITQNWKRYSAKQINNILNKEGSLWQAENYDHIIRNEKEFAFYIEYTLENPVKARLVNKWTDWKYSWLNPEIKLESY